MKFNFNGTLPNIFLLSIWLLCGLIFNLKYLDTDMPYKTQFATTWIEPVHTKLDKPFKITYNIYFIRACDLKFERWMHNNDTDEQFLMSTTDVEIKKEMINKTFHYEVNFNFSHLIPGNYTFEPKVYVKCNMIQDISPEKHFGKNLKMVLDK